MGSRRTTPTFPVMAAVVSVLMAEPRKTPWVQSNASNTSGITAERREPKINPEIGTPCGSSQLGAIDGHCDASTVNRELGCAAGPLAGCRGRPCQSSSPAGGSGVRPSHHGSPDGVSATLVKIVFERPIAVPLGCAAGPPAGCHGRPCQSSSPAGGSGVRPSHHGSPDGVSATLVKIVFERTIAVPLGFVLGLVFGATPKKPRSGLMARSWPWASTHIQAMSSPSVHARQPGSDETTMARFVLPDALGMAAAR